MTSQLFIVIRRRPYIIRQCSTTDYRLHFLLEGGDGGKGGGGVSRGHNYPFCALDLLTSLFIGKYGDIECIFHE